jgi:hypothetical protein
MVLRPRTRPRPTCRKSRGSVARGPHAPRSAGRRILSSTTAEVAHTSPRSRPLQRQTAFRASPRESSRVAARASHCLEGMPNSESIRFGPGVSARWSRALPFSPTSLGSSRSTEGPTRPQGSRLRQPRWREELIVEGEPVSLPSARTARDRDALNGLVSTDFATKCLGPRWTSQDVEPAMGESYEGDGFCESIPLGKAPWRETGARLHF